MIDCSLLAEAGSRPKFSSPAPFLVMSLNMMVAQRSYICEDPATLLTTSRCDKRVEYVQMMKTKLVYTYVKSKIQSKDTYGCKMKEPTTPRTEGFFPKRTYERQAAKWRADLNKWYAFLKKASAEGEAGSEPSTDVGSP